MVKSPIKVIESGNVPTTDNLGKGQVAFGQVGGSVKLYGSDGTTVTELGGGGTEVNNIAPLTVTTPPTSATETGIAIGNNAKSAVTNAIAIGTAAGSGSTSSNSVSIGTQARGVGVAIGTSAAANASDSVTIGGWSSTNGLEFNQVALGTYSRSTEANTVSVGSGSSVATLSDDMTEEEQAIARAAADVPTRRIVNVTDPRDAQDAATKNYVDTTLDQSVQRDTAISASESTVNIGVTKGNIGDKSSTTNQVALPVASATSAGVLNASTFQAIQNNAELVDSILDGTVSLDSLPSDPSQEDLTNAWKTATERDTVINGATIDDQVNTKTWRYYTNIAEWRGNDAVTPQLTVNQWSNTSAGIIKGSTTAGQIFAEADGTGSVNGWDDHESRITNNTTNITALQTNVGTLTTTVNSKADQDDLEALQTTVAGKADSSALANYATKEELASKADTSALANYATKSELDAKADASDLADYATKAELATKADTSALADYATKAELAGKADTSDLADYATKTELSSKANASDLANYLTKTDAAATYATKVELATKADQSVVDSKVASVTAGTGITISGDAQHPVINATAQKIDQYSSTESPSGNIGTTLNSKQQSTLTPIGTTQGLSEGDTIIYTNSYQATVTEVTGDSSTGTYSAVIFFVPTAATFATLGGQPTDNVALNSALEGKADVSAIPTVNDATVTINAYGSAVGSFTLNQAGAATINIPEPTINLVVEEI